MGPRRLRRSEALQVALAAALGAGVVASGFTPFNHATDVLDITERPWLVLVTPSVVLAALAVLSAVLFPLRPPRALSWPVVVAGALLLLSGVASLGAWSDLTRPALLLATGYAAPLTLAYATLASRLPRNVMCGAFLTVTVLLLLRADIVFFQENGLPSVEDLFRTKYSNEPYDFHYYTLGNPDYSAAFLLIPLTLAAFWAADPKLPPVARTALVVAAAIVLLNVVLVFVRLNMLVATAIAAFAVIVGPVPRRARAALAAGGALALLMVLASSEKAASYFGNLGSEDPASSGPTRLKSIADGLSALASHPFDGVGIGRFGLVQGIHPAHSSIVQSGAEAGVGAFLGALLLTGWALWLAWRIGRRKRWRGLAGAAALASGAFCLQSAIAGGPPTWLASEATAIWGLSLGLVLAAVHVGPATEESSRWLTDVLSRWWRWLTPAQAAAGRAVRALQGAWRRNPRAVLAPYGVATGAVSGWAAWSTVSGDSDQAALAPLFQALHVADPGAATDIALTSCVVVGVAVFPTLLWDLFASPAVALLSPVLLLKFSFLAHHAGIEWVAAYSVLVGLPVLMRLDNASTSRRTPYLILLTAAAGLASSVQPGAGLALVAVGILVVFRHERPWLRRLVLVSGLIVVYLSVTLSLTAMAERDRSSRTASARAAAAPPSPPTLWQSAYFGLGWYENAHGVDYRGDPAAGSNDESVGSETARSQYLEILSEDPGYVARSLATKAKEVLAGGADRFWLLLPLLPAALLYGSRRRRIRRYVWLTAPALALAFLAPVVAAPLPYYELGFMGALGVVWLVAVAGSLALLLEADARMPAAALWWSKRQELWRSVPVGARYRAGAVFTGAGLAAIVALTPLPDALRENSHAFYAFRGSPPLGVLAPTDSIARWSLLSGPGTGWLQLGGARTSRSRAGLRVTTGEQQTGYQLIAPVKRLPAGRYHLVAVGRVEEGGLMMSAVRAKSGRPLATAQYSELQSRDGPINMGVVLATRRPTDVKLVFSNWAPHEASSRWVIQDVQITRVPEQSELALMQDLAITRLLERNDLAPTDGRRGGARGPGAIRRLIASASGLAGHTRR